MSLARISPYSEDDTSASALAWEDLEIELGELQKQLDFSRRREMLLLTQFESSLRRERIASLVALLLFILVMVLLTVS